MGGSSVVTQRTWTIEAEGKRKRTDAAAFTADAGRSSPPSGRIVGFAANIHIRWHRRDGSPNAYEGTVAPPGRRRRRSDDAIVECLPGLGVWMEGELSRLSVGEGCDVVDRHAQTSGVFGGGMPGRTEDGVEGVGWGGSQHMVGQAGEEFDAAGSPQALPSVGARRSQDGDQSGRAQS